jgi:hypothetical protein
MAIANSDPATPTTRTQGKGFFGCAGLTSSVRTGIIGGMGMVGMVAGGGSKTGRGAAGWGNGETTVCGN